MIEVEDLTVSARHKPILEDYSLAGGAGRRSGHSRCQRRRQDHACSIA